MALPWRCTPRRPPVSWSSFSRSDVAHCSRKDGQASSSSGRTSSRMITTADGAMSG